MSMAFLTVRPDPGVFSDAEHSDALRYGAEGITCITPPDSFASPTRFRSASIERYIELLSVHDAPWESPTLGLDGQPCHPPPSPPAAPPLPVAAPPPPPAAEEGDDDASCVVCLARPRAVVLLPCRHLSLCALCAAGVSTCPMCRGAVEETMVVFV